MSSQSKKTSIKASSQSIKSYLKPSCLQPSGLGTTKLNELHSKEAPRPISIEKFSLNGQNLFEINHDMLDNCKIEATLLSLDKCTIDEKNLFWPGSYAKSSKLNLNGMYCSPIKINYESTSSFENGIYFENKLAVIPIENLIQIKEHFSLFIKEHNSSNDIPLVSYSCPSNLAFCLKLDTDKNFSLEDKFVCPHCKIKEFKCDKKKLRHHIAKHILIYKDIKMHANLCGFCGRIGCNIALKATSGKGKQTTYGPDSSCIYEASFSLGCSSSTHSPSTNRPIECPHCKLVLWSYNLQCHYSEKHQTSIAPDIDAQEIIRIQNFKK
jgi:hypothetical protein